MCLCWRSRQGCSRRPSAHGQAWRTLDVPEHWRVSPSLSRERARRAPHPHHGLMCCTWVVQPGCPWRLITCTPVPDSRRTAEKQLASEAQALREISDGIARGQAGGGAGGLGTWNRAATARLGGASMLSPAALRSLQLPVRARRRVARKTCTPPATPHLQATWRITCGGGGAGARAGHRQFWAGLGVGRAERERPARGSQPRRPAWTHGRWRQHRPCRVNERLCSASSARWRRGWRGGRR
jgi:hypothetical protein